MLIFRNGGLMKSVNQIIHANSPHQHGFLGQNTGIAIVDTGLTPHPDYRKRIVGWFDALHGKPYPYDDSGHGSHVAGIAAGDGFLSQGRYEGVAPMANLIGIKVLNNKGNGTVSDIMKALRWIQNNYRQYGIRIVNISIGANDRQAYDEDCAFVQKVNELWDMGLVVVAAAGNQGPGPQTISAPGNSRKIITVGSLPERHSYSASHSGIGPTLSCIKKPDVVAPGSHIVSCCPPRNGKSYSYSVKSGTSMSTPIVSGAIALLLSKYPYLNPREIKIRMKHSCTDLNLPHEQQGWGLLHVTNLLREE